MVNEGQPMASQNPGGGELGTGAPARSSWSCRRARAEPSEINEVASSESLRSPGLGSRRAQASGHAVFIYCGTFRSALPCLFCTLNKAFVMRLPFGEAVQKPPRNGANVTGLFFPFSF